MNIFFMVFFACLTGCVNWNDEFEGEVVRAYPRSSIHKINGMVDGGIIFERDIVKSDVRETFRDGAVVRGAEDIRRMYVVTYEDQSGNLYTSHYVYFIAKPAKWISK